MASHDGAFRPWERRVAGVSGAVSSLQGPVSCQWIGSVMGFLPKKKALHLMAKTVVYHGVLLIFP